MDTFYNYGVPATREIISVARNSAGEYDWAPHVTRCQYLAENPLAPWNRPDPVKPQDWPEDQAWAPDLASHDPADYPGELWTPPLIVELIKIPQPDPVPGKIAEPILVWTETSCTRDWVVRDMTPSELDDSLRKVWPNTQAFLAEFTLTEMAGIGLSTDPTIAALRLMLSVWSGQIYSDDERVITGLSALQVAGIITSERQIEISTKY